jgi:hypothetical protein
MAKVTIELDDATIAYLKLLDPAGPEAVLGHLAASAADGLRRPGAWERQWLSMAFPEPEFTGRMDAKLQSGELAKNEWDQLVWKTS